jgi:hypothetical protein
MSYKLPPVEEVVERLVWNREEKQALVELLERRGFLSSPYRSYYDYEVRREIILRLAEIGDESALPILRCYVSNYGNVPEPTYEAIAEAAQFAIEAIEKRTEIQQEKREDKAIRFPVKFLAGRASG